MISAVDAWDAFSEEVRQLIVDKSAGYGNAWQEQGYMGNLARVLSKASRIKNLAWRDNSLDDSVAMDGSDVDPNFESVEDTLKDSAALCAFFVANLREGRRWG